MKQEVNRNMSMDSVAESILRPKGFDCDTYLLGRTKSGKM